MKKKLFIYLFVSIAFSSIGYNQDLSIGNVSAGMNSYNQSTGELSGIYFDVLNNDNTNAGSFRIAIFLVDPNNVSNNYEIGSIIDNDGQSGNTVVTYSGIDIDIDDVSGIPSGDYRVAVCADEDNDVFESDETNNCLYITTIGNNITYNSNASSISQNIDNSEKVKIYPNPVKDNLTFEFEKEFSGKLLLFDITGNIVKTEKISSDRIHINVEDLKKGTYFYKIIDDTEKVFMNRKFLKI